MGDVGAEAMSAGRGEDFAAAAQSLMQQAEYAQAATAMERAYAAFTAAGDLRAALRTALMLIGLTGIVGEMAAGRGWEQRGLRLAARIGPCVERGYLALCRVGCEYHDPRQLLERAELALSIAAEFGDRELEIRALADKGLALVSQGRVEEGFALLDDAMTAVSAREISDPKTRGVTVCAMFSACERTGDTGRADYWCRRVDEDAYYHEGASSAPTAAWSRVSWTRSAGAGRARNSASRRPGRAATAPTCTTSRPSRCWPISGSAGVSTRKRRSCCAVTRTSSTRLRFSPGCALPKAGSRKLPPSCAPWRAGSRRM